MKDHGETHFAYVWRAFCRHRAKVAVVGGVVGLLLAVGWSQRAPSSPPRSATLLSATLLNAPFTPRPVTDARARDKIYEAVLRRVLPRVAARKASVCYVSFNGHDPDGAFIRKMRQQGVRIERMSRSPRPFKRGRESGPATNPRLMVFYPRWVDASHVEVKCDWPGGGDAYILTCAHDQWKVTDQRGVWVS